MQGYDVIVCGSLHLDIVVHAPALPRIDETAVGRAWNQVCGGKGGNQAVQAAAAGARVAMIGCIGADDFGDRLLKNLGDKGVDARGVAVERGRGSGMSVAILQDDGNYGAVIVSGANLALAPRLVETQWKALQGARVLVLQNEIPEAANIAAAEAARASGAIVVLNAAPARAMTPQLLNSCDVLVVNRVEAETMAELPITGIDAARQALPLLQGLVRSVVITLGGDGLVVSTSPRDIAEIAPLAVKVTSTHGAGDCFVGTLAASLARGDTLALACGKANIRAAEHVSRLLEGE